MNERANFASILDEAPTEINRPKPLPEGTYLCVVGQPEEGKSSKKGTRSLSSAATHEPTG